MERPQHRGCLRGRSQRKQVFGADRLKYPMKRKHWEPLTGGDKSLRGKDEWERITWDEALDYVAAELKNVIERYGNAAILGDGEVAGFLNRIGGFTSMWGTHSFGAYSIPVSYTHLDYDVFTFFMSAASWVLLLGGAAICHALCVHLLKRRIELT